MGALRVHQSLWAMPDVPAAEAADRIAAAGFAGAALRCAEEGAVAAAVAALRGRGLGWVANIVPRAPGDIAPALRIAARHGAESANAVVLFRAAPRAARDALARWLDAAGEAGVALHVETHRGGFMEDGHGILRLLDALPALRLTADLSHLVVGHAIKPPFLPADLAMLDRVLGASDAVHLRLSTSEQAQVSPAFARHAGWLARYQGWWGTLFADHHRRHPGSQPVVVTELGPPASDYPVAAADGAELSDRWDDALRLRRIAENLWRRTIA